MLHIRYWAWLTAAPVMSDKRAPKLTRLQKMRADRKDELYEPDMPLIVGHEQLMTYFWDVGPAMAGPSPLTHTEIFCWQQNTGNEISSWEAQTLRAMSIEYVTMVEQARVVSCPSPLGALISQPTRAEVAKKVENQFAALMMRAKEPK